MRLPRDIAYASTAARDLTEADLDALAEESRRLNTAAGVTGLLLYCDGNFMQYIEGPADAVAASFARIRASRWHYQVNELMDEPGSSNCEFAQWSMGFSRCLGVELLELVAGTDGARPGPGREMLRVFWRNCRTCAGPG